MARNTVVFSVATGLSRIAGLVREIVASSYFGTSAGFSAFTIAFQVPNVVRSLFADAALSAAFVPVFTELLEQGRRRDAFRLASSLFFLILAVLGGITVLFVLGAGVVVPLFVGDELAPVQDLAIGLSQVLFPVVLLLGLNGLTVGILNAYDQFTIPALSPLVWNVVILAFLVGSHEVLEGDDQLYGYAVGVLAGTAVQLGMTLPQLRQLGFRIELRGISLGDERVRRVLALMLPVTIGLGLVNFNLLVNSTLGTLVSEGAPRAIDAAFRIYMLPQGLFSVAIATVLFPALSRLAARRDLDGLRGLLAAGTRQILLTLVPAAAATLVLAEPITRLIYEHGEFGPGSTDAVSEALFWFAFSLPTSGVNLLLTRTFFSLQRPWTTAWISGLNLAVNVAVSVALYAPLGIAGIVIGTAVGSAAMTAAQLLVLRGRLGGRLDATRTALTLLRILVAAAGLGAVAWGVWHALDDALGRSLAAQLASVTGGLVAGGLAYAGLVLALGIPEARQIAELAARRLRRARGA
jgi:putative peptidoglycan lipid II flippase